MTVIVLPDDQAVEIAFAIDDYLDQHHCHIVDGEKLARLRVVEAGYDALVEQLERRGLIKYVG